jgi:hypothetical protein
VKTLLGAALTTAAIAAAALFAWRITRGVEAWFAYSGAADTLMWSVVAALILAVFAIPAAAWGFAARCWLIKLRDGERVEATHGVLLGERPRRRLTVEDEAEYQ